MTRAASLREAWDWLVRFAVAGLPLSLLVWSALPTCEPFAVVWTAESATASDATPAAKPATVQFPVALDSVAQVPAQTSRHRSPTDVAVSPDGRLLLTANHTSDTASLVDAASGTLLAELPVGRRPFCAAVSPDGRHGLISNTWSGTVSLLSWEDKGRNARVVATIPVGPEPRGVAFSADGRAALVVVTVSDEVVRLDLTSQQITHRAATGVRPWHLALSPDGQMVAVAASQTADMHILRADTLASVRVVRTTGDNLRRVAWEPAGRFSYVTHIYTRGFPTTAANIGRGWVIANHVSRTPHDKGGRQAIALDVNTKAVGDADGIALSPDGKWIVVAAGGTHELLILSNTEVPWVEFGGPDDFIDDKFLRSGRFRRVDLGRGSRPLAVAVTPDSRTAWVADYFGDALHAVDLEKAERTRSVSLLPLGEPDPDVTPERRGEMLFADALLSHHQWYSCHTCHTYGHTSRTLFDTFNDKSFGNGKDTPSLRGAGNTGPWTWHGWQKDLTEAMSRSVQESMQGPKISAADAQALAAYVRSLDFPPNPFRNPDGSFTEAAKRGRTVFRSEKAACARCHSGEDFTDGSVHDVGTGSPRDALKGYNPPTLRGVYDTAPYLHDGRAKDLRSLLTRHHAPEKLGGKGGLTDAELNDLIEYLRQL